jgi:hypothetical protein
MPTGNMAISFFSLLQGKGFIACIVKPQEAGTSPNPVYHTYTVQFASDWKQTHRITNKINVDQFPVANGF